jgi:hypothetical protein
MNASELYATHYASRRIEGPFRWPGEVRPSNPDADMRRDTDEQVFAAIRPGEVTTAPILAANLEIGRKFVAASLKRLERDGVITKNDGRPAQWRRV